MSTTRKIGMAGRTDRIRSPQVKPPTAGPKLGIVSASATISPA